MLPSVDPTDVLLTDKVALVTGGGAGIGQGIAIEMAAFGADVVIAEIDPDRANVTAELVEAKGRRAYVVPTDLADTEQIRAMVDQAKERFGRIDILVNNVGGVRQSRFLDQSERSWRRHVELNLFSVFACTSAIAPLMIEENRGGSIVNIASIEALRAAPEFAVYAACKAGIVSFTRTMALELAQFGIRVNALAPDVIATPGLFGIVRGPVPTPLPSFPAPAEDGLRGYIPLGRAGTVEEFAAAAVFLSSPMGRYITGVTVSVDGGTFAASGWSQLPDNAGWQAFPGSDRWQQDL